MVNFIYLVLIEIILLTDIVISTVLYKKEINLFFLKEREVFYEAHLQIEISDFANKHLIIDSLPSDLIDNLRKNHINETLEISLNQGQLDLFNKKSFVEYKNYKQRIKRNNNYRFAGMANHFDYFFDSVGNNLLFSDNLVNTPGKQGKFYKLLDNFAVNFKFPKFYLTDPTNSIKFSLKNTYLNYVNDYNEKPCIDNLEGIRRLFPYDQWELVKLLMNYQSFVDSEFKSIKYTFREENDKLILGFAITHIELTEKILDNYISKYEKLSEININTFSLSEGPNQQIIHFQNFLSEVDISSNKELKSTHALNLYDNYGITSQRRLKGSPFGFKNFELIHEILLKQTSSNQDKKLEVNLIDLIPEQFDVLFSTIQINYDVYNDKGDIKTQYYFDSNNFRHFLDLSFNITEMQHPVLWSYEFKRKININLNRILLIPNSRLRISIQLRKRLINFESFDNEFEFGYKIPSGIMLYSYGNEEKKLLLTDQIYFNLPNIDNTMPFNIIALTFVIFGILFIQTLNMFLGNNELSFIGKIKEKLMSFFRRG